MSNVTTKSILLSQPKIGQGEIGEQIAILPKTVIHTEEFTLVKVEIPGVDPSTVDVKFDSNALHVKCEKGELTFPVDPTVDTSRIKADIQWGLLTVSIPAPVLPEARSIKVSVHDVVKTSSRSKVTEES